MWDANNLSAQGNTLCRRLKSGIGTWPCERGTCES